MKMKLKNTLIKVKDYMSHNTSFFYIFLQCLLLSVFLSVAGPVSGAGAETGQTASPSSQRYVTIDFNDVDINIFIKYISELTKKNFVVDRAVKGKVTIISPTRISETDAYKVFESVLEINGYTTVPSGSIIKIVPSVQARSKSIATIYDPEGLYPEDKVVTQIIQLKHSNPNDLKKILAPLVSKTSVVISHPESGLLIITDVMSNISRLLDIIKAVDVPSIGEELVILPLKHASATNVAKSISQLFLRTAKKGVRSRTVRIIPYERTNSLIIFAPKSQIRKIRNLLVQLDAEVPRGKGKIHVYYLQNASAEELVKVLTTLPGKQASTKKGLKAPPISTDSKIMADPETNSLIITAPREEYLVLEDVIKKLDIPRRMVYMEALIMEVSVNSDFAVGVKWGGGGFFDDGTGVVGGSFGGKEGGGLNILDGLSEVPPQFASGFNFGVLKQGIKIGNVVFPNIAAVLTAYRDDSDINIIATPQILTTDNKKALINVGENIPYITSKNENASNNDYTSYEYKDVGTRLEITPQINQADLVRLEIAVEVTKVKTANEDKPTTFKRNAETTVVVHNEETVVIGGIIGQDTSSSEYKVPLLGDIPILGWLFKTHGNSLQKTNLFIFITPHIVENQAEIAELYYKKRDIMEYVQPGSSEIPDRFFHGRKNPEHAMALTDIGFAKLEKKEYGQARQYFEQALKINSENPYALINLGVVCERQGDTAGARELYQKVLQLEAVDPETGAVGVDESLRQVARENLEQLNKTQPEKK